MPGDEDFLIRAAGGLVWRSGPDGRELLLVHRRRYDDWSLPKGKLEPGEGWSAAARREVLEETGYPVDLGAFAGVISYVDHGRPKVVLYWNMTLAAGPRGPVDDGEVAEAVWLPVERAVERLTYPDESGLARADAHWPRA